MKSIFFFQAEDGIRDYDVTGVQTCALPICCAPKPSSTKTMLVAMARIVCSKAHWMTCGMFPKSIIEEGGGVYACKDSERYGARVPLAKIVKVIMHATGKLKKVDAVNASAARNASLIQRTSIALKKFPSKSPTL